MGDKNSDSSGVDNRNESVRRYDQFGKESTARKRHGEREREYQEKTRGLKPKQDAETAKPGSGSPTQGAFGKEGPGAKKRFKNVRDRDEEREGPEREDRGSESEIQH